MRLLNRLLVLLFVRRKAQAHARAVLAEKRRQRATAAAKSPSAVPSPADNPATATAVATVMPAEAVAETANTVVALPASPRETLIRDALAARKLHEAEWDALTPAQQSRAIASLGEGMAAIVKTFRAA